MKKLLDLKGDEKIKIDKRGIDSFDVSYDFEKGELSYTDAKSPKKISSYIISKELAIAVNAAIVTGRPLLLKGEPGCGKTQLAKSVAAYFHKANTSKYYFEWHVKSRSKAKEGGYIFDHVSRLRDATIAATDEAAKKKTGEPKNYISLGPMGKAFKAKPKEGQAILLIDEIDKGDIDFPNDLLLELDEMRFEISELTTNNYIEADKENKPLVIITSNDERELPPAFLRRCLYYRIPPFKSDLLALIANSKLSDFYAELSVEVKINSKEVTSIVEKFLDLKSRTSSVKPPSTSELLDWLKLILFMLNENKKLTIEDVVEDRQLQQLALKLLS